MSCRLVASPPVRDLSFRAKDLLIAPGGRKISEGDQILRGAMAPQFFNSYNFSGEKLQIPA